MLAKAGCFRPLTFDAIATGVAAFYRERRNRSFFAARRNVAEHRVCRNLPELLPTELALVKSGGVLNAVQQSLVEFLREEIRA